MQLVPKRWRASVLTAVAVTFVGVLWMAKRKDGLPEHDGQGRIGVNLFDDLNEGDDIEVLTWAGDSIRGYYVELFRGSKMKAGGHRYYIVFNTPSGSQTSICTAEIEGIRRVEAR